MSTPTSRNLCTIRRCAVVTSAFHMPRTRSIFSHCFSLAGRSLRGDPHYFQLSFHAAADEGTFSADVLSARKQREAQSLQVNAIKSGKQCRLVPTAHGHVLAGQQRLMQSEIETIPKKTAGVPLRTF